jgi:hypothetical protein
MENETRFNGGLIINKSENFKLGQLEDVEFNDQDEIILKNNKIYGRYVSPIILTDKFKQLVSSWNINTPEGSEIELSFQVRVDDKWSEWFSYGKWTSTGERGSIKNQKDKIANMDIDTLEILEGKEADAFKYNIILKRRNIKNHGPKVRSIFATLKLSKEIKSAFLENKSYLVELDVPERSQKIVPEIGNRICSPTSLAMVLEYYGHNIKTEEVAEDVLDRSIDIYGNWSYNVAYAGSKGLTAYVARFSSVDEIKDKIADGIPIIASIKTKEEGILMGAPTIYPSGHLLVVRGFTIKDGEEYIIVNDPASPDENSVRREYKLSEFERAWSKIVYILKDEI